MRSVTYNDRTVIIDGRIQWLATDLAGSVYGYEDIPAILNNSSCWSSPGYAKVLVAGFREYDKWRSSLQHVDDLGV